MHLSFFQIFLAIIAIFFMGDGVFKFVLKKNNYTYLKFFFTLFVWGGVLIFSVFPFLTHTIVEKAGAGENLNTLIFSGFVIVFVILFKFFSIIEKIERDITTLVRKNALNDLKSKK